MAVPGLFSAAEVAAWSEVMLKILINFFLRLFERGFSASFVFERQRTAYMAQLSWSAKVQRKPKTSIACAQTYRPCPSAVLRVWWAPVLSTGTQVCCWKLQDEDYGRLLQQTGSYIRKLCLTSHV
ncbi:uncharacterized protein LOC135411421 isoform X2 [Pseudopipra pipra]|uniref:uncharacterized protein LOC135411421 isoform X2 n=1 Tax=Pseudopipra pipra TaxID=415032 RepID=UPI003139F5B7